MQNSCFVALQMPIYWLFFMMLFVLAGIILLIVDLRLRIKNQRELKRQNKRIIEISSGVMGHNQMLIDGLEYAKHIQSAMLPDVKTIAERLNSHLLISFPKTIVGGDFYWAKQFKQHLYLIVADSTGHGIPGGFMSMLGMAFLNSMITAQEILPHEILEQMRSKIKESLKQYNINQNNDGIDMFCCRINFETMDLAYSGAMLSGFLLVQDKTIELRAQKTTVGFGLKHIEFETKRITIAPGNRLFVFTDGFTDQFNTKGERFTTKKLIQLIESHSYSPLEKLKPLLSDAFLNWKTDVEQTDDALLLAVEI